MEISNYLKSIYKVLNESGCTQIEFYESQDAKFNAKNGFRVIKDVYKIRYMNSNYKFINFYLTFNNNNLIYRASNRQTVSFAINAENKTNQEINEIIEMYLERDSHLGFDPMEFSLQSSPVRFLDSLDPKEINIYVEILRYKNTTPQSSSISDFMFFDNFLTFETEFLPLFL
ncbi:hypothetical protein [Spiroplasma culicicola]|uniref:Uncharacterized protein n=1 Tax=Spiroplasma culicicola AES-1 TaxID=1276246 RepID=W6A7G9_9MOLU|nr:hypothetical protein [Spiroplasma culicicola]AHI52790.1 hypothetical protein SCULI_v1c04490 [Spiroplasma culicicola AES-1]